MNSSLEDIPLVITVTPRQGHQLRTPATAAELLRTCSVDVKTFSLPSQQVKPYQAAQILFSDDVYTQTAHRNQPNLFTLICTHLEPTPILHSVQTHALYYNLPGSSALNRNFEGRNRSSKVPSSIPFLSHCQSRSASPSSRSLSPSLSITSRTTSPFNPSFVFDTPLPSSASIFEAKLSSDNPPLQRIKKKPRKYKPADKKVHTVPATLPEEYRIH
jgi:hypothetical protein